MKNKNSNNSNNLTYLKLYVITYMKVCLSYFFDSYMFVIKYFFE